MSAWSSTQWTLCMPRASPPSPAVWRSSTRGTAPCWPCQLTQSTPTKLLLKLQELMVVWKESARFLCWLTGLARSPRSTESSMPKKALPVNKVIDATLKVIQTFQSKSLGSGAGSDVQPSNFPIIKSKHSLVAKHVTREKWEKLKNIKTKASGFTLYKAIA